MEIFHHVGFNADGKREFYNAVKRLGIEHEVTASQRDEIGLVTFDIPESDPSWQEIEELIREYGAINMVWTSFTPEEIINSKWNRVEASYEWGYPQPETKMKWKSLTYDNKCSECGAGFIQVAPFIIKREPSIGRKHFFSLFWAVTLFCKKEIVKVLEDNQISGYQPLDPIIRSTQEPSKTVTQLVIPEISLPGLIADDRRNPELCPVCGITKFAYHKRGKMRINEGSLDKDLDFQMSDEWFGSGSGYLSFREIFVSNRLSRLILEKGWRGVELKPVELV
jgi:hypothetical protein